MTRTARYNATDNSLQELPAMENPEVYDRYAESSSRGEFSIAMTDKEQMELAAYLVHRNSLRRIPCSPECDKWTNGDTLTEGKDYEIKSADEWKWCLQLKGNVFAAPVVTGQSEDELWKEIFNDVIPRRFIDLNIDEAIAELKKHFIITKR